MGFSITWFAIREQRAKWLLERLGLTPTGESEEVPESLISTCRLQTGWQILWYNEYDCPWLVPTELETLSREQELLVCRVEEHVMASSAELWANGSRQWRISHEGEAGPMGLSTDGSLPDCLATIQAEMEEAQRAAGGGNADVDYIFDIPLKVAQCLVGFKHDEDCPALAGAKFEVLKRTAAKKSFFERLFAK